MGLGVVIQFGVSCAPTVSNLLHGRADSGEGGGEVVESLGERGARMADREGNELHPSPVFLEDRDEGGVFSAFS